MTGIVKNEFSVSRYNTREERIERIDEILHWMAVAICRVLSEGEEATVRAYVEDAGYEVLPGAIAERIAYREAQNRGQAITETKSAKLNEQADALMEALINKVMTEIKWQTRMGRDKWTERK